MKTIKRTMAIATLLLAMSQSMWAGNYTYKWARVKVVCPIAADKVYLSHDNGEVKKLSGTPIPDKTEPANEVDWTLILHSWNDYAVYVHGIPSNDDEIFVGVVEDDSYLSNPIGHFAGGGGYDDDKDGWKQPMKTVLTDSYRNGIEGKQDGNDSADDKLTNQTACNRVYAWKDDPEKNTDNSYYPQGVDKTYYAVFMKKPEVTLGEDGIATYSFPYGLYVKKGDQAKIKIYGANLVEGKIKLNSEYDGVDKKDKRAEMPGNTGVILIGEPGTYTFNYDTNGWVNGAKVEAENPYNDAVNVLKSTANGPITADGSQYVLGKKGGVVRFYRVKEGATIPANKAYITVAGGAKEFLDFSDDDNTTAIAHLIEMRMDENQGFNLQGQCVDNNYRGIIVKNGKKYINK